MKVESRSRFEPKSEETRSSRSAERDIRLLRDARLVMALRLAALMLLATLGSCTYYRAPLRVYTIRTNDTLSVGLTPLANATWEASGDSVVLDCPTCAYGKSRITETFADRAFAQYGIPQTQAVNLMVFDHGKLDTTYRLAGIGNSDSSAVFYRFPTPRRRRNENNASETPRAKPKEVIQDTKTVETKKKAATLHVTAAEGVAVYKDKSKSEVIKILPQGTTLTLLAREGDLYSVAIGDGEGFVEAEAVQIDQ